MGQINIPPTEAEDFPHSQPIQAAQDDDKLPPCPHDICKQAPHLLHGIGVWGLALLPKLRDRVPGGVAVDILVSFFLISASCCWASHFVENPLRE